jgi:hypothetical protein
MENKKLLKYLLKDLSELDEMFSEEGKNSFDDLEMEFIQNRVTGAKKLVQLFIDHANEMPVENQPASVKEEKLATQKTSVLKEKTMAAPEEKLPGNRWVEAESTIKADEIAAEPVVDNVITEKKPEVKEMVTILSETPATVVAEKVKEEVKAVLPKVETSREDNLISVSVQEKIPEMDKTEPAVNEIQKPTENIRTTPVQRELQMDEEEPVDIHNKRLGDSFSKEKSVNDLMGEDFSKLEHKLSNRPVISIQSAIGINDRFQYIRELFEGSAESFTKTVADLDSMNDLKEAVNYLQNHFKWKKNETSLKFVNLIKRRFPNE